MKIKVKNLEVLIDEWKWLTKNCKAIVEWQWDDRIFLPSKYIWWEFEVKDKWDYYSLDLWKISLWKKQCIWKTFAKPKVWLPNCLTPTFSAYLKRKWFTRYEQWKCFIHNDWYEVITDYRRQNFTFTHWDWTEKFFKNQTDIKNYIDNLFKND